MVSTHIYKGVIFDIKKFAVDDGPGIRTTLFLKGCPLRCWWCHNPEGQLQKSELMYRRNICIRCGECTKNCERQVISFIDKQLSIDRNKCNLCTSCVRTCPSGALSIVGKRVKVEEAMEEVNKDLLFYTQSNGGITISGGEPLMQIDFLEALLTECKKAHIRTAVDTSGYSSHESIERIKDKVDLFLYDLKIMDDKKHRKFTGVSNKLILENFRTLAENGSHMLIRFAVIPNINDDEENLKKTAHFIASCGVNQICLLPYHKSGIEKYRNLGRTYELNGTETPSNHKLNSIREQFEALGLHVKIGGTIG